MRYDDQSARHFSHTDSDPDKTYSYEYTHTAVLLVHIVYIMQVGFHKCMLNNLNAHIQLNTETREIHFCNENGKDKNMQQNLVEDYNRKLDLLIEGRQILINAVKEEDFPSLVNF